MAASGRTLVARSSAQSRERSPGRADFFSPTLALRRSWVLLLLGVAGLCPACHNQSGLLDRSQHAYEKKDYELALANLRTMEQELDSLSDAQLVRYSYLRGMADSRLGFHRDARYWLSLAQSGKDRAPEALTPEELERLGLARSRLHQPGPPPGPASTHKLRAQECQYSSDCPGELSCQAGYCAPTGNDRPLHGPKSSEAGSALAPEPVGARAQP